MHLLLLVLFYWHLLCWYKHQYEMTEHTVNASPNWDNLDWNLTLYVSGSNIGSWFWLSHNHVIYAAFKYYRAIFTILGQHISVRDRWLGMCEWPKEKKSCWQLRKLSACRSMTYFVYNIDHCCSMSGRFLQPVSRYLLFFPVTWTFT